MRMKPLMKSLTILALAAVSLHATGAGPGIPRRPIEEFLVDLPSKEFEAQNLQGETVALSDFRGKVLILNFWGIWCPPCREEIPELVELYRELQPQGLEILAVNTGDPRSRVPAYVEKNEMTFPVVLDDGATDLYEVMVFPTSYVLDRSGRIRYIAEGHNPRTAQDLRLIVDHLLRAEGSEDTAPSDR